jgi:hypothetical protein
MASIRFADLQSRPTEFLDFTSLTLDEFQQLVSPFEAAFQVKDPHHKRRGSFTSFRSTPFSLFTTRQPRRWRLCGC